MYSTNPIGKMVKIVKLHPDSEIPRYSHQGDAGADLFAYDSATINPGAWQLISTGIALALPATWVGLVHPRSGLAAKKGVTVLNTPGTIDSGYRGEILVNLINHGVYPFEVKKGDRIAQIVFQQFEQADFFEVESLDVTVRGENGIGSTGGFEHGSAKE